MPPFKLKPIFKTRMRRAPIKVVGYRQHRPEVKLIYFNYLDEQLANGNINGDNLKFITLAPMTPSGVLKSYEPTAFGFIFAPTAEFPRDFATSWINSRKSKILPMLFSEDRTFALEYLSLLKERRATLRDLKQQLNNTTSEDERARLSSEVTRLNNPLTLADIVELRGGHPNASMYSRNAIIFDPLIGSGYSYRRMTPNSAADLLNTSGLINPIRGEHGQLTLVPELYGTPEYVAMINEDVPVSSIIPRASIRLGKLDYFIKTPRNYRPNILDPNLTLFKLTSEGYLPVVHPFEDPLLLLRALTLRMLPSLGAILNMHGNRELYLSPNEVYTKSPLGPLDPLYDPMASNLDGTINVDAIELADAISEMLGKDGFYMFGHGTGRSNPDPRVFLQTGLRIPYAETSNTATGFSSDAFSNGNMLIAWPHLNSRHVVLLPAHESKVGLGPAGQRFNMDWFPEGSFNYINETSGKGLLRQSVLGWVPNLNGNALNTTPEAPLGVFDSENNTFLINHSNPYFTVIKDANGRLKFIRK